MYRKWVIMFLHSALIHASVTHRKACRHEFQNMNLSDGQPKVLAILLVREGCLQKDLAQYCRVEPATMTSLLKKMTAGGLIIKESVHVSGGKRAYGIYLTDLGREKAAQVKSIIARYEDICFEGFSEEERNATIDYLERITKNLQAVTPEK